MIPPLADPDLAARRALRNHRAFATALLLAMAVLTVATYWFPPGIPTEKLAILAMIAWKQHTDSATILTASIKSLRGRLAPEEYRTLLAQMPGFAI